MKTKSSSAIPFDAAFDMHVKHISSKRAPSTKTNTPGPPTGLIQRPLANPTDNSCIILDSETSSNHSNSCIVVSSSSSLSSRSSDSSPLKSPLAQRTSSRLTELRPISPVNSITLSSPSSHYSKVSVSNKSNSSLSSLSLTSNSPYSSPSLEDVESPSKQLVIDGAEAEYVPTVNPVRLPQRVLHKSSYSPAKSTSSSFSSPSKTPDAPHSSSSKTPNAGASHWSSSKAASVPPKASAPLSVESLKKQYARPSVAPRSPSACSSLSSDLSPSIPPPPPPRPRSVVASEKDRELEVITQRKYTRTLVFSGSRRQADGTVPSLIALCQHVRMCLASLLICLH